MEIKSGTYRHHKGGLYRVIGVAKHSETLEDMVAHEALYDKEQSQLWVRPLEMFTETVEVNGETEPRFEFVGG